MDVDRHKFLLLTAAITAATTGGCAPRVGSDIPPATAPTPTPRDDPSVDVGSSDISERMVGVLGGDSAAGPVDEYGYAVDEYGYPVDEYGHPIDEYGPVDEYGYPIGEYGPVDEYGYVGPQAEYGPVDEYGYVGPQAEYAPPPPKPKKVDQRCRRLKAPGPTCESFEDTKQNCGAVVRTMKKKWSDRAVSCLQRKSGSRSMCSWEVTGKCIESSLRNAKIDSQSSRDCRLAERKCGGVSSFDGRTCRAAVSSAKPEVRDRLAACIAEFCEVGTCFYYLD